MYKAFLLVLLTALSMATTATASPSPADAGTDPASYREMHRLQQTDLEKRKSRRQAHAKPAAPPAPYAAPEPQLSGRQMEQKLQNARRKQAPGAKP